MTKKKLRHEQPPAWVAVGDEGIVRVLQCNPRKGQRGQQQQGAATSVPVVLSPVFELANPAAHANDVDLRKDAMGRRSGDDQRMGGNATTSAGDGPTDIVVEQFARRVIDELDQAFTQGRFSELHVVAAPKFLGHLRKQLEKRASKPMREAVVDELNKDLAQLDNEALAQRLFGRAQTADAAG